VFDRSEPDGLSHGMAIALDFIAPFASSSNFLCAFYYSFNSRTPRQQK
jgi:hypothetical protein